MITLLLDLLQLLNFGPLTTSTIQFESCHRILFVRSRTEIDRGGLEVANNILDIIKIAIMIIKIN